MAVWPQTHENSGSHGLLFMTDVTPVEVRPGGELVLNHVHVENRGNQPASSVDLKVYLSANDVISDQDTEIASFRWETFNRHSIWGNGSLTVPVPDQIAPGAYRVGIILSTPTPERSTANNTAILLRDFSSNFAARQVTIASSASNPGDSCGTGLVLDCVGSCVDEATVNAWTGDGSCDDGSFLDPNGVPVNLVCSAFNDDGGDCTRSNPIPGTSCGTGRVFDCVGSCVDEVTANDWVGDGFCDDGTFEDPNGVPVNLVCNAFNNDAGDCDGNTGTRCVDQFGSAPDFVLCEETATTCGFNAFTNLGTCEEMCNRFGSRCVGALDNDGARCIANPNNTDTCQTPWQTEICVCER